MADKLQVLMQFEICDRHFFVFMSPSPPQWRIKAVEITTAAVWEHAVRVFGNQPKAQRWLHTRLPELQDRTPDEVLNEDPLAVEAILGRIEDGVFS